MQGIWGSEGISFAESFFCQNALRCLIAGMPDKQRVVDLYTITHLYECMLHRLIIFVSLFVLHTVRPETCNTGSAR